MAERTNAEEELLELLRRAQRLVETQTGGSGGVGEGELGRLRKQIEYLESETTSLNDRYEAVMRQHAAMVTLFVSSERLHASLEPSDVAASIWEILVNLVGAESFFIAVRTDEPGDEEEAEFEFVNLEGISADEALECLQHSERVGQALQELRVVMRDDDADEEGPMAVVPLRLGDQATGVIVIFKLLDHKGAFVAEDNDVLELLGGHAATAFVGATAYARLRRKVRTMESLMGLLKK